MKREIREILAAGMQENAVKPFGQARKPSVRELLLDGYRRVQQSLPEGKKNL